MHGSLVSALIVATLLVGSGFTHASGRDDVAKLRKSKDVNGLMRLLRHQDGEVRRDAAVALSNVIRDVKDSRKLARHILPLIDVTLRDPYVSVREYAGRALQHSMQHVTDVSILRGAVPPLLDMLRSGEVEIKRRQYAAVRLSTLIGKIEHESLLVQSIPTLLKATIDDSDEGVREYAGRALKSALPRVRDKQTLHDGTMTLVRTLQHKDTKRRIYSAVLLSWLVPKVTELNTLRSVATRIKDAAKRDRSDRVRDYAGRADRHIEQRLQEAKAEAEAGKTKRS